MANDQIWAGLIWASMMSYGKAHRSFKPDGALAPDFWIIISKCYSAGIIRQNLERWGVSHDNRP